VNFVGEFDPNQVSSHSGGQIEVGRHHGTADTITIPDANLLFTGDFKRSGVDLILSKDGHDLVVADYFKGATRAALASPDGAQLSGSIVNALTGHVEYAQAGGGPAAATVIGHVTKLSGSATAIRNGVSIELHVGDNVNKGDVVQAGADSSLGLTFIDGTVFGLSANARMVLNDMVYDPNGSSNSSLLSLVQGTITFLAGETAKHGDMKVNTPVATMGIRGTAVLVEIDFQVPGQGGAPPVKFQVLVEPGGRVGDYVLYSLADPTVAIGEVNRAGLVTNVNGNGDTSTSPAPPLSDAAKKILEFALPQIFDVNPHSTGPNGSTPANPVPGNSNPDPLKLTPPDQPTGEPHTIPINLPGNTPGAPSTPIEVTFTVLKAIDVTPVVNKANFLIGDQVTISDSNPSDVLVPYVAGSAHIISVVGPANGPSQADLMKLLTLDLQTGLVTYDPANFAFLAANQHVVITIGFESSAGSQIFQETLTETIDGFKHAPVISSASLTVSQGGTVLFTPANLGITDPDSTTFTFSVSNVAHGTFQTTTDGVHWTDATTFTSADLAANHVRFVQDGSALTPTFSIQADDGGSTNSLGNLFSGSVTLTDVHQPPVITAASLIVAEGGTVVLGTSNIVVDDPGSSSFTFTVSNVAHGSFQTTTDGIHWVDALTFTTGELNAGHVRFVQDGSTATPTFSIQADDGAPTNHLSIVTPGNASLDQPPVIEPPQVADPGPIHAPAGTPDGHGGFAPVVLSNNLGFTDANFLDSHIVTATFDPGASNLGPLTAPIGSFALNLLQDSTGGNQGLVTWSFTLSSTDLQNIDNASFMPPGATVHEVFDVTVDDGHGGTAERQVSIEIDGPPVHVAPVIDPGTTPVVSYQLGGGGVAVDAALAVSDVDSATLQSASIAITNFQHGDTLIFANTSTITGSFDTETGVLTLTGADTVAHYQAALDSISFQNLDFGASTADRSISFQVDDGSTSNHLSNIGTATVSVSPPLEPFHWINPNGGLFTDASSWSRHLVPGANDDAAIDAVGDGTYTVTSTVSESVNTLAVNFDAVLDITGGTFAILNGTGASSNAGLIEVEHPGSVLTISGAIDNTGGTIEAFDSGVLAPPTIELDNAQITGGTVEAIGGGKIDVAAGISAIDAAVTIDSVSRLVVSNDAVLNLSGTLDNAGQFVVRGVLDVQDGTIHNTGIGDSLGILIDGGVMLLDGSNPQFSDDNVIVNTVRLTGGGTVLLDEGLIAANPLVQASGTILALDNIDNTISGDGQIGIGAVTTEFHTTGSMLLTNETGGTIDSNFFDSTLTIDTGSTITNKGLLEATNGGTLDIQDSRIDNTGTVPQASIASAAGSKGILVGDGSFLEVDAASGDSPGTLHLDGHGTVTLQSGSTIEGNGHSAEVLDNTDNSIVGAGAIGTGDGLLTLQNDRGGTIDATGGTLTLDTGNTIINHGLMEATDGGALDIADSVRNSGTGASGIHIGETSQLLVDTSILRLDGGGTVSLDGGRITENANNGLVTASGAVLGLDNIDNTISGSGEIGHGTVQYHHHSIGSLALTNGPDGTIDAIGGTLTIDTGHTIINTGLLEATTGGTLVVDDAVTAGTHEESESTGSAAIGDGGILEFMSCVDSSQTVTFKGAGTLYLANPDSFDGEIAGISSSDVLDLAGFVASETSVTATYDGDTKTTTLHVVDGSEDQSVDLTLAGDHHTDNFAIASDGNGGALLVLNQETPTPVTNDDSHTFTTETSQVYQTHRAIEGSGLSINSTDNSSSDLIVAELDQTSSILTSNGDGLDMTSLAAGIAVFNSASAIQAPGWGIFAAGDGNVTIGDEANTTVSGHQVGIEAASNAGDVDVNIGSNATVDSTSSYGILAINTINNGSGNISVRTSASDLINSGSAGIGAISDATAGSGGIIAVDAFGTINSGGGTTGPGIPPAGILAGYLGGLSDPVVYPVPGIHGDVIVNSSADINAAAGDGIRAFNYGTGNITVNDDAGTITALGGSNPTNGFGDGISARNYGPGDINVFTAADAFINAGSSGIFAENHASASPSGSEISVLAFGTINSGTIPPGSDGSPAAGILAGYNANDSAENNVHGNVIIDDHASITAAAGTDGIRGYDFGTGTVTIIAEADAVITAGRYGLAARGHDGGDVSVINYATVTAATAIEATTTTGNVKIDNHGIITGNIRIGDSAFAGDTTFDGHATIVNESDAFWHLDGSSSFTGSSQLINDGLIDTTGASSITTTGSLTFNNAGVVNVQSGSLDVGATVTGSGIFNIGSGSQLEFGASVSANQTVTFQDATGMLKLDDPADFTGHIAGITGSGQALDLAGIDAAHDAITATTGLGSFNGMTTTLTVTDQTTSKSVQLTLVGNYSNSTWTVTADGHGGADIADPPALGSTMVAANGINPTLTGTGPSDTFVFDFAGVGQATVTNFHADTDLLQIKSAIFANAQAILDATRDDGHGNSVIALDAHDSITLTGVTKAQLHQTDFHLV
jgi:hypothetical protein